MIRRTTLGAIEWLIVALVVLAMLMRKRTPARSLPLSRCGRRAALPLRRGGGECAAPEAWRESL